MLSLDDVGFREMPAKTEAEQTIPCLELKSHSVFSLEGGNGLVLSL